MSVSKEWVKEKFSRDDIIEVAPKSEIRRKDIDIAWRHTLKSLIEIVTTHDVSFDNVHFKPIDEYRCQAYLTYVYEYTEEERFELGLEIIQKQPSVETNGVVLLVLDSSEK